jgi:SAM-dependent methyltransferase
VDYLEENKELWNAKTEIHFKSDFYDVKSFLAGKNSLNPIEFELLGDVRGKSILHLQCHFGMDTISLSRLGAKVTGVDFSDAAIAKARSLAKELRSDATFIESDVYSLDKLLDEKFDIVFTSYGVIGWLPDMEKWATVVNRFLKPNGVFILVEFHPFLWIFNDDLTKMEFDYFNTGAIVEEMHGTYADPLAPIHKKSISWNHNLSEVMESLLNSGLQILKFEEFNYSPYDCFMNMIEIEPGKFQFKGIENKLPMIYALKTIKNGAHGNSELQ